MSADSQDSVGCFRSDFEKLSGSDLLNRGEGHSGGGVDLSSSDSYFAEPLDVFSSFGGVNEDHWGAFDAVGDSTFCSVSFSGVEAVCDGAGLAAAFFDNIFGSSAVFPGHRLFHSARNRAFERRQSEQRQPTA